VVNEVAKRNGRVLTAAVGNTAWAGAVATLALLVLAALILLPSAVHATTYKWVDDKGVVHYTDKLPPEAINKGSVELNKQGVTVKKNDPALTPEQRRALEADEERGRQVTRIREERERKDRALLQTYTTESEIDLAKSRALSTIEGQMQSSQAYSATLNKKKQEITARLAALGDKQPPPPTLNSELANVNDELAKQADLIATKQKEITVATARYDADKQRWRELRVIAENEATRATPTGGTMATGSTGSTGGTTPASTKK
jgi:hypothetical protein